MAKRPRSGSVLIGTGILLSRLSGLAREMVAGRVIGNNGPADALVAALRIPNLLQNLLGEGVLSASFVPVYSELLDDESKKREASRVASAVGTALMLVTGLAMLVLVIAARPITRLLAWGLTGENFELAVNFTRITVVGIGFLVMSAWCLGVLNSHRRFFLPYVAPVVWNATQVVILTIAWQRDWSIASASRGVAIGVTIGGLLQLLVQLPVVLSLAPGLKLRLDRNNARVREVLQRFGPALLGRGAIQLNAYLDLLLASFLAAGGLSALFKAQMLYTLPISLFAMSVAASELPELSRLRGDPYEIAKRSNEAMGRIAFWMVGSTLVLVTAGEPLVGLLFQGGAFSMADTSLVWLILAAYSVALPAAGLSRMLQNAAFAMGDTRTPARMATFRVITAAAVGLVVMFPLDRVIIGATGVENVSDAFGFAGPLSSAVRSNDAITRLGPAGLALGTAVATWAEIINLHRALRRSLPQLRGPRQLLMPLLPAAAPAFALAAALKLLCNDLPNLIELVVCAGSGGALFVLLAFRLGIHEADMVLRPVRRVLWR
jgi:putative peptidoglycan lipid II flippase